MGSNVRIATLTALLAISSQLAFGACTEDRLLKIDHMTIKTARCVETLSEDTEDTTGSYGKTIGTNVETAVDHQTGEKYTIVKFVDTGRRFILKGLSPYRGVLRPDRVDLVVRDHSPDRNDVRVHISRGWLRISSPTYGIDENYARTVDGVHVDRYDGKDVVVEDGAARAVD
ncbi:hypothetical protein ACFL59_11805 [Planctomycetota bacterium]